MKHLCEDPAYGREMAHRAKSYIEDRLSMERISGIIVERIGEIYEETDKESIKKSDT